MYFSYQYCYSYYYNHHYLSYLCYKYKHSYLWYQGNVNTLLKSIGAFQHVNYMYMYLWWIKVHSAVNAS